MDKLTLSHLAAGLAQFAQNYSAIDVFADDLQEIEGVRNGVVPATWHALDETGRRFFLMVDGKPHVLDIIDTLGVVRLAHHEAPQSSSDSAVVGAVVGGVAGAAITAATSKKGNAWAGGLMLGLLVGAYIGNKADDQPLPPRRVFTMRFDASTKGWVAYDGGLVPWMKTHLLPAA